MSSKFSQILQYLTNIFSLELADLSTLDFVSIYFYTITWFVAENFVFCMIFSVLICCAVLIFVNVFSIKSLKSVFFNLCVLLSCAFDLLLVSFSLFFIFTVRGYTKSGLSGFRVTALDYFSTWTGDLSYRYGTLFSLGHTVISFCTDITSFVFIISSLIVINSWLVFYRTRNSTSFVVWLLLLKCASTAAFSSADVFSFTIFMELSSIAVLCLYIGSYQTKRSKAALHYIIYTSVSGVLLVAASLYLAANRYSIMFDTFCWETSLNSSIAVQLAVFTIFIALTMKIPTGPFYHWLLFAHVEASTPVSIVLAAILLKIPAVAVIRIFFNSALILPDLFVFILIVLCVATIMACSSSIWLDGDVKRVVALSSIVHMTGTILILFGSGRIFIMFTIISVVLSLVSHTFLSSLMFAWSGTLSERYHTRDIFQLSGVLRRDAGMVFFTFLMCFFVGAVPISFVFTAEVYMIAALGISHQFLILVFILVAYSIVFVRVLYVSCRLVFGHISNKVSYGLTKLESGVFILFTLCLVATLFVDGGITSIILLCGKRYLPVGLKRNELRKLGDLVFDRFLTKRSPRHKYSLKSRSHAMGDRNTNLAFETLDVKRRRRIRFYLNLMRFRKNLGVIGRGPFTSGPIKFDYSIPFNEIDKHYFINFDIYRGIAKGSLLARRAEMLLNYQTFFPPEKPYFGNPAMQSKHQATLISKLNAKKSSIAKEKAALDKQRIYDVNRRLFGGE